MHLVIDAANVVGSRPDGWWRDRAGAAARLVDQLSAALGADRLGGPVTIVLEGAARAGAAEVAGQATGPAIIHAPRDGDSAIVALVESLLMDNAVEVVVVTADRGLRGLVTAAGAQVRGPSWLLEQL